MDLSLLCDPLSMNLCRQWNAITPYIDESLLQPNGGSQEELVDALARLLYNSRYTLLIAQHFRPILLLLCAKWLDQHGDEEAKLAALALLIQPYEDLFPILSAFIRHSHFNGGPLAGMPFTNTSQMHVRLLAYYRILVACPHAPALFQWSHEPLLQLLSLSEVDNGICWLFVHCYSRHTGMSEAQREELQISILGPSGDANVVIEAGRSLDGSIQLLDGWLFPVFEVWRVREQRRGMLEEQEFYRMDDCHPVQRIKLEQLTCRVVDIHGVLLLKAPSTVSPLSTFVSTPSAVESLRALAIRLSLRLPTLISSPPSCGKSVILKHLVALLHPASQHQIVTIHLSDTSIDGRSLLGSYVSSTKKPGSFEWQEGVIVRAMRHGLWLVLEDIDRASSEVLGALIPLIDSLAVHKHIGAPASLEIPGHGRVDASETFALFATRSVATNGELKLSPATFLGCKKFSCVDIPMPTEDELVTIVNGKFPRLGERGTRAIVHAWADVRTLKSIPGTREVGIHELETWCRRVENLLPPDPDTNMEADQDISLERLFPHISIREEMYLEARDVFFGSGAFSDSARVYLTNVARIFARHLGLSEDRAQWVLENRLPELHIERNSHERTTALTIGKVRLPAAKSNAVLHSTPQRPFAMHRPALLITERISTCVSLAEPVLLVGETGTGKTTLVSHIAALLHHELISLNLSHQTESSDLLGGFKPVDPRVPASELQREFLDIFSRTFSRRKNSKFEEAVRKALSESKWKRAVGLWRECTRLALDKIKERATEEPLLTESQNDVFREARKGDPPRKRRKLNKEPNGVDESQWLAFAREVEVFNVQHVHGQGKFAFGFVEGPLIQALKKGNWILLDEINLASPETLECISGILQGPTASIVLTEQGSFAPVQRHPDFRLFACMNPATDVGKKDLPANIRSRFTEIHMSPPDADRETLLAIVHQYIGHCSLADKSAPYDVAEFYLEVKKLSETGELADGSNHRPHYSMRTLARALVFASDLALSFGLRRALWEGCLMAFSMSLNEQGVKAVKQLGEKCFLAGVKNVGALMAHMPPIPGGGSTESFVRIGPFWLECGDLELDPASEYILTPSVQAKLIDLTRAIVTRRFPVLIEGPTSSGKTSAIEYLARKTGHRFVRVNNHEHTDIQEYLGTYVSDPESGNLVFHDGILVRALRNGDWIVLDELNLAPTDVLEALNRLLDDNRELIIPETQEVVRPHPHFMLFATQNPPGLYAGRKVLSRAFRNRFLEIHFDDVPQSELRTILSERCRIPESYASRIVTVFQELSKRRQAGRVFESKHGFATLRDLFRWAGREASSTRQLAQNGYMLLAERARRPDDKEIVKEVIETVMKERIDLSELYGFQDGSTAFIDLGVAVPTSSNVIWTSAMRRLFNLVASALKYDEPVLLVGDTGSGKTTVCQLYADAVSKHLITLNCHQSTETADLIGSQRPLRNRLLLQAELMRQARESLRSLTELAHIDENQDVDGLLAVLTRALKLPSLSSTAISSMRSLRFLLQQSKALFEWYDGPLIRAMRTGDVFLLDEISLADDSVLERLNSVLEPARNIVLAERGGFDVEHAQVTAHPNFKLFATMNPGGDYGKKELSPALRNRFTEIWVPQVELRSDLRMIILESWRHESLLVYTDAILAFMDWLSSALDAVSVVSLRDVLSWVQFADRVLDSHASLPTSLVFHHGAHMIILDGLETSAYASSWPMASINTLREQARAQLELLVPLGNSRDELFDATVLSTAMHLHVGSFGITKGHLDIIPKDFSLQAPTTSDNIRRLVRACQLAKPILLEGSPGVGKTSLVVALGHMTGRRVFRVNLSDQTDLVDLFGADFPVEGGQAGEFTWKDATFLQAMQGGDWVLLDEMNLAPQAVLEGLNAVLDHRGTVFIPELGRSFTKHPEFRIFAAQNPLHQGGGRKGLPKSFLDRFTKVYIQALTTEDLFGICQHLFPALSHDHLRSMIRFNLRLSEETMIKHTFGRDGSPWEFNLRDIIRWATLLSNSPDLACPSHPFDYLDTLYLQRFRTDADRFRAMKLFYEVFDLPSPTGFPCKGVWTSTSYHHAQFGSALIARADHCSFDNSVELQRHLQPLEAASLCMQNNWLMILSGGSGVGKTQLIRYLASKAGRCLYEYPMNSAMDTADILGSFEQISNQSGDASRFEWIDGPLVRAMKKGHWMVFDNANLCSPSVLDRVNSLCEPDGVLVLTERGLVNGEVETLRPDPQFRLILTMDPRNGDLSRAMRNRGIEIHMLSSSFTPQDKLRLLDTVRMPSLYWSEDNSLDTHAIQFGLVRRAISYDSRQSNTPLLATHCALLNHDSIASVMLDGATIQQIPMSGDPYTSTYAQALFAVRMLAPSMTSIFRRLTNSLERCHSTTGGLTLPSALFNELDQHPIWNLRQAVGESISHARRISPSFISAQPLDIMMNPSFLVEDDQHTNGFANQLRILSSAIGLFVRLHFYDLSEISTRSATPSVFDMSRLYHNGQMQDNAVKPGVSSIFPLYKSTMAFAHAVLRGITLECCEEQQLLLEKTMDLVDFAGHLHNSNSTPHFDFTSAIVISTWFHETLTTQMTHSAPAVSLHAEYLSQEVSLRSGHGMQDIWRNLVLPNIRESVQVTLTRLDSLVTSLNPDNSFHDKLRLDTLNVMSLLTLTTHTRDEISVLKLCDDIEQSITSTNLYPIRETTSQYPPQLAIAELEFLWRIMSGKTSQNIFKCGDYLIKLASHTACTPLARFTPIQHHLWTLDAHGNQLVGKSATVVSMIQEWMSAAEDSEVQTGSSTSLRGHNVMLKPIILHRTSELCLQDQALYTLESHEKSLRLHGAFVAIQCHEGSMDRLDQILHIWTGVLQILAACFKGTFPMHTWKEINQAASGGECNALTRILVGSANVHFARIVRDHLMPVSQAFDQPGHVRVEQVGSLGRAWVNLGLALLELYLPNLPLDPVAAQRCTIKLWKDREIDVLAQLQIHESAEKITTGNESNPLICILRSRLDQIRAKLQETGSTLSSRDVDLEVLHALFGEITPFVTQVLYSTKFKVLLRDLEAGHEESPSRALVVQATISGFVARLKNGYSRFSDIIQPISLSLSLLKFGLHLLVNSVNSSTDASLVGSIRKLVRFPTVATFEAIQADLSVPANPTLNILLTLLASAYGVCLDSFRSKSFRFLDDTYHKIAELWLADLHDQERETQESQSLYRHKSHHDTMSATDDDEMEFSSMFPTYEDASVGDEQGVPDMRPSIQTRSTISRVSRLSGEDKERVYEIHLWIMSRGHSKKSLELLDEEYDKLRTNSIRDILASHLVTLPHSLDMESLPFQALLLSREIGRLNDECIMDRTCYNFYHSPNVPEVKKALSVVRTLQRRLLQLIKDWPEQMVLHHLMARCDAVLQLNIRSPVAKILSMLEQLLVQTEDWQMYSNQENTLKPQQAALSELIIHWRRFELSSWPYLLESHYLSFCAGTADWWFRLFELTIRGTLAAVAGGSSLEVYFADMIPLLEQFINGGPLGQFAARLELLDSFGVYSGMLSHVRAEPESDALARASRIMRTLYHFFNQYSNSVARFLSEKRTALEKELSDYIRLASWKDVNVHALKQSAQRTHRQLFKCVRRFRDVLREPVASAFFYKSTDPTIDDTLLPNRSTPVSTGPGAASPFVLPHVLLAHNMPNYMLDLQRTLARFENLLKSHGEPLVKSINFGSMDSFADQVSETVAVLSSETDAAGSNMQMHKTLMMRKRKAWIDLLQELKRIGLSSRLKPEVLDRHQDKVWLLDRPSMVGTQPTPFHQIVLKAEHYFSRMLHLLPELSHSLSSHNGDLTTRELQRAVTFVQSIFAFALGARDRFSRDYMDHQGLEKTVLRLKVLATTHGPIVKAHNVPPWLELCCKIEHALKEIYDGCVHYDKLADVQCLSPSVLKAITTHLNDVQQSRRSLTTLCERFHSTHTGLMVTEESDDFCTARSRIMSTTMALNRWMDEEPRIRHLCSPVLIWLTDASSISDDDTSAPSLPGENKSHKGVVDRLLLSVQSILSLHSSSPSLDQRPDKYILDNEILSGNLSRALAVESVRKAVDAVVDHLVGSPLTGRLAMIQTILPFLDVYLCFVQNHLHVQCQLVKSSFKLSYVLCRVVLSIVQKGFCKPAEVDDECTGPVNQSEEVLDGTGLGHGTGSKDVSDQIQDESQVEGLRGEESTEDAATGATDGDGIEMGELAGDVQDIDGDDNESGCDDGSQADVDDEVGETDPRDPGTVDEKLWGDETVSGETAEGQSSKKGSKEQNSTSETVANEDREKLASKQDGLEPPSSDAMEESADLDNEEMPNEHPIDTGMQMDNFVPEADTLDIPDNLDLSTDDDGQDKNQDTQEEAMDEVEGDHQQSPTPIAQEPVLGEVAEESSQAESFDADPQDALISDSRRSPISDAEDNHSQPITLQPDLFEGDNQIGDSNSRSTFDPPSNDRLHEAKDGVHNTLDAASGIENNDRNESSKSNDQELLPTTEEQRRSNGHDSGAADSLAPVVSPSSPPSLPNPLRNLGDTLKEIRKRWDQIRDAPELDSSTLPRLDDNAAIPQEIEYMQEGTGDDHSLQALGPAKENQITKLRDLQINDDDAVSDLVNPPDDFHQVIPAQIDHPDLPHEDLKEEKSSGATFLEGALTHNELSSDYRDHSQNDLSGIGPVVGIHADLTNPKLDEKSVEVAVKAWQESGHMTSAAGEMWRLYDSLTHDLSFSLCEQLRLILEPTLATRLRGDYRTGKRLNMKKIIPYIASEYTKDKIWLRRTRPSQREYQILIALDDSRSMAESRSVHLAYEALALVSKALNRLESGEVAIARFGEDVEIVHAFEDGMVDDQKGAKVMQKFKFEQRKTDVLGLVDATLRVLMQARERKSMGRGSREAADLWQLEIIISDGICQDHEKLRSVLRRAEEQRVMIVFVIIDSLHTHHNRSPDTIAQNSILSMSQVSYKEVEGGHKELQLDRYLDSFPFQYYIVLRDVEALPEVLSGTLKQFFERISEE